MNVRDKEPRDQPWVETILNERWGGGGQIIIHGDIYDARNLPALVAGEQEGLATYQIRRANDIVLGELITLDAIKAKQGVGTAQSIIPDTQLRRPYLGPIPSFPALSIEGKVSYRPHSRS